MEGNRFDRQSDAFSSAQNDRNFVDAMNAKCGSCGQPAADLREGVCFSCASNAEDGVAKRSVEEHLQSALKHLERGLTEYAEIDIKWAYERLTRTGQYGPRGDFAKSL